MRRMASKAGLRWSSHCSLVSMVSAPRAGHASKGRARFLALHTAAFLLLHRELGWVAVFLVMFPGLLAHLHREEEHEGAGRAKARHAHCLRFLFFSLLKQQNDVVLHQLFGVKTAPFH
ncbi:hypothetical protein ACOSP7_004661 [Xanthoceras sorbifolium]